MTSEKPAIDYLGPILARKRVEVARRRAHRALASALCRTPSASEARARVERSVAALRRGAAAKPRVIAEIKFRSPSAGQIRPRTPGAVSAIARDYAEHGAAAVSVLCDRRGFGGTPLDVRRVAGSVHVPVLFKEFVLDKIQIAAASALGAHMVLLLVRALSESQLHRLVVACLDRGLVPVVEAADDRELDVALGTDAPVVGVNARDLRTFRVDTARALSALARVDESRVAVHMSGVKSAADVEQLARSRADAVLIGESLMRASDPGARLASLL